MILAYFIILRGDEQILRKMRYDEAESGIASQLGERLQNVTRIGI